MVYICTGFSTLYLRYKHRVYNVQGLQCTGYTVYRVYSVQVKQCTGYTVYRVYSVQGIQCTGYYTVYKIGSLLYKVFIILYRVLYSVQGDVQCTKHGFVNGVHCTKHGTVQYVHTVQDLQFTVSQ